MLSLKQTSNMRKYFFFLFLTVGLNLPSFCNTNHLIDNKVQLVLQIPQANAKNIDLIKNNLKREGFEFTGYCEEQQLFCFRVATQIVNENLLSEIMKKQLPEFEYYIKLNAGLEDIKQICPEIKD